MNECPVDKQADQHHQTQNELRCQQRLPSISQSRHFKLANQLMFTSSHFVVVVVAVALEQSEFFYLCHFVVVSELLIRL